MKIKIGTGNRICFPKQFCIDNNINQGDEFEIIFQDGKIIFIPEGEELNSLELQRINLNNTEDSNTENSNTENSNTENSNTENSNTGQDDAQYNNSIDYSKLPKNFKELCDIPLSDSAEYKPNLLETTHFYARSYSKCGLICKSKAKYVRNYCSECKGQLLHESVRDKYCPYYEFNSNTNNVDTNKLLNINCMDNNLTSKSVSAKSDVYLTETNEEESINKVDSHELVKQADVEKIDVNEPKSIVQELSSNVVKLQKKIDDRIARIKKLEKMKQDSNSTENHKVITINSKTVLSPVQYLHHHQCYKCEEYFDKGFIIGDEHFYCKECAIKDFKRYLDEVRRIR